MSKLTFGVIGTSKKEDEQRIPIHPEHLPRLPEQIRRQLIFEESYGAPFGIADTEIATQTGGVATRHEILANIGNVIIPTIKGARFIFNIAPGKIEELANHEICTLSARRRLRRKHVFLIII